MSSPIPGDSSSLYERPEGEQIHLKDTPLEKPNAGFPTNTPTDPNPVVPGGGDSPGHVLRDRRRRCHHQFSRSEDCSEKGWGPEFFSYGEDPGTPIEMDSSTHYDAFASGPQSKPLQEPSHGTGPNQKPRGRRNARKSTQPAKEPQSSGKIQKKKSERRQRHGKSSRTTLGQPIPPEIQRGLEGFREQLRLLEEQNQRRLQASQVLQNRDANWTNNPWTIGLDCSLDYRYLQAIAHRLNITIPDTENVSKNIEPTMPKGNGKDPWGWVRSFAQYKRTSVVPRYAFRGAHRRKIGGDGLDITTWSSAERKQYNSDDKDPLSQKTIESLKEGLVSVLG
ncbi:hypothetical protein EDB81DRAFT_925979 [Dactylonectria macrodidyma]|uniref:Uncharacterized protein n=1 Tax=Dactylonectria macrodidyma TaxID=307937 RepID=A0A9P9D319_9HYPO|nr:hypothetical protein EDB81DRAFT_925979 [Dactylonectria macrodidyma]